METVEQQDSHQSRPSALPLVFKELIQSRQKRSGRSSSLTGSPIQSPMVGSALDPGTIKYGELQKTSRSRRDSKAHGLPRRRRFRLTEDAIEYFQHFSQVKLSRSFPLTSIEKVELVHGNPTAFQIFFHSFIMELEASNPFEANDWMNKINEGVQRWKEAEEILTEDETIQTADDDDDDVEKVNEGSTAAHKVTSDTGILQRKNVVRHHSRQRSHTSGMLNRRQSTEDGGMNTFDHRLKRKSFRRKLRLAPKLEKQRAVVSEAKDEVFHYKKLHDDYAMIKYPRRRRWAIPSEKIFKLDKDNLQVMWRKNYASKMRKTSSLCLDSILEIRLGQYSSGFERFPYEEVKSQSFSLMYETVKGKYATLESLDLVCDHPEHFNEWINGLDSLNIGPVSSMFPTRYENTDPVLVWLKKFWSILQESHEISEKEVLCFADHINPSIDTGTKKRWLIDAHTHQHEAILSHGRALKWDGFVLMYNIMCGETGRLYTLFRQYAKQYKRLGLTLEEFKDFLITECYWTEEDCSRHKLKELIAFHDHHHRSFKKYTSGNKPSNWKIASHLLSFAGFMSFLRSKQNSPINLLHNTVYQDMTQPLSHYFINSSHNTYLEGDQVKGKSSLDAYVRSLLLGSRCIEIDCWDNTVGREPIVYHGYTLTTKLPFGDVIRTIKDYAFRMSFYPLIISIENHCSSTQQARMASIFVKELKDHLGQSLLAEENLVEGCQFFRRRLPSPLELQGKILLKGSYKHQTARVITKADSKFPSRIRIGLMKLSQESTGSLTKNTTPPATPSKTNGTNSDIHSTDDENEGAIDKKNVYIDLGMRESTRRRSTRRQAKSFRQKVIQHKGNVEVPEDDQELFYTETSDDLKDLIVYCRSTSIKPWSWQEQKLTSVCQMFSFSELSAADKFKQSPKEVLNCTERQFVRVYPRGARIDSSNYNPIPHWNHGIQMVALNYQTPDVFMHLNQGRFRQNGGCGYVLKPEIMRKTNAGTRDRGFNVNMSKPHPKVAPCNFEIELLSGQNLCFFSKRYNNVIVSISLHGIPNDCCEMTRAESNETFWPQWPEGQHYLRNMILMPELCLVYFRVDLEGSLGANQIFGQNCIALSSLLPGIKFIQLRKPSGELIPESGLFVRMKIKYDRPRPSLIYEDSKNEICFIRSSTLQRQSQIEDVCFLNPSNSKNDKMKIREASISEDEVCSMTSSNSKLNYQVIPTKKETVTSEDEDIKDIRPDEFSPVTEIGLKLEYREDEEEEEVKSKPPFIKVSAEVYEP